MNSSLKKIFSAFVVFVFFHYSFSQVSTNWVTGSGGAHQTAGNLMVSSTIGEAMVKTFAQNSFVLTQGFHQSSSVAGGFLLLQPIVKNASCLTSKNGEITSNVLNGTPPYTYSWSPEGGTGSSASGLGPGTYYLFVTDALDREGRDTVTVGAVADDACEIHVFHGITPNGDGVNDRWHIDGIKIFPENTVTIYNRWGERVWTSTGYNNSDNFWEGQDMNNNKLSDGTYFYILEIPGVDTNRGWVQLTR